MATLLKAIIAINDKAEATIENQDIDKIVWENGTTPIPKADILAKQAELTEAEGTAIADKHALKASAKAKLVSGEALTEDEANTIVL
tara:strand:+ start:895 stop:1155 length:261 start_codon:yes stop_codon:yes gene_type:complete